MHQQKVKAGSKTLKTLKEIERELEYFGLTNQGAACIVRFANTLKSVRKLRSSHILLLTPSRRLHPPSPLSQHAWNQDEIEDEFPASAGVEEIEDASSSHVDEASHAAEEAVTVGPPAHFSRNTSRLQGSALVDFSWLTPLISLRGESNAAVDNASF
ncbi:hypothetical protein BBK36DRAFT_1127113 [Trichoderma citrinoviride]|uniref:Uncharacterized protein n=1 Tax=Trichoderma citrinoviride TaxID=58853 RepID=A0A2T4B1N2_9HYPO|nr:hypothetical protein BBK36DRAFT_1127113 [Trichoderma citrinoviride]PTB63111.1 hypothetical protein BBK36DRAFT_1127113 [Trichoderma citrinoviride]